MSQHHRRLSSRKWERVRLAVFKRDSYKCQTCGHYGRLFAHHVKSLDAGGAAYDLGNIVSMCSACHDSHHKKLHPTPDPERKAWRTLLAEFAES